MTPNQETPATRAREFHQDPITGEPGAHPVGTGVGAASGGVAGAAIGSAGGPIGTAVGAVVGAIAGGFAGKGVAEIIDPTAEDAYWRAQHPKQRFADPNRPYEDYAPAYRAGYAGWSEGKNFADREAELRREYEAGPQRAAADAGRAGSDPAATPGTMQHNMSTYPLRWEDARAAAQAAYERVARGEAHRAEPKPLAD